MRWSFRQLVPIAALMLLLLPARAQAQSSVLSQQTTIQDLLGLQAAGMTDDILIGLFQSNGTVFSLNADDLIYLRQQGLSERVLIAMLNTRQPRPAPSPVAHELTAPRPQTSEPVVVNVDQQVSQTVTVERQAEAPRVRTEVVHVPVAVPVLGLRRVPRVAPKPVYWGFGGQRRPDSWDPTPTRATRPPAKTDPTGRVGGGGG